MLEAGDISVAQYEESVRKLFEAMLNENASGKDEV